MFRFYLPLGLVALAFNPLIAQAQAEPLKINAQHSATTALPQTSTTWTLRASVNRAIEIAPEMRAAAADIDARSGDLTQAEAWPNPTLDVRADNKLGIESGTGGMAITQLAFSQPIPLGRLSRQRDAARINLESAQENRNYQRLQLEHQTSRVYFALQLASARHKLAEERLRLTADIPDAGDKTGKKRMVRYLTPLERQRLSILHEEANQALVVAEQAQQLALIDFNRLLALPQASPSATVATIVPPSPANLVSYMQKLDTHPALTHAQKEAAAAQAEIAVVESQRYADPSLILYHEHDYIGGAQQDINGIGISVPLPLWSNGSGSMVRVRAEAERAQARLAMTRRDMQTQLEQAHAQLLQVIARQERIRSNLLEPAQEVYTLTQRGFTSGEFNILALVDANNTYFEARTRYLELQHQSELAAAELQFASGMSILDTTTGVTP